MCITGPLTDWGTVWLAKRNKGVYEPEFRIFFISTMLFGVFGYVGWAGETFERSSILLSHVFQLGRRITCLGLALLLALCKTILLPGIHL